VAADSAPGSMVARAGTADCVGAGTGDGCSDAQVVSGGGPPTVWPDGPVRAVKAMIRRLDWIALVRHGVNFFVLEKFARVVKTPNLVVYALMRGETFEATQTAPAAVPQKGRHRQIKRICDRVLSPARGGCRIVEIGAGWGGLAQTFAADAALALACACETQHVQPLAQQ